MTINQRRVVVTGLGALTPIGNNVSDFWKNLLAGVSGAAPITYFDASTFKTQFACELKDFAIEDHFDRKEARKTDPFNQYALIASGEALEDSGLDLSNVDLHRFGVIWASGNGGIQTFENDVMEYAEIGPAPRFNPFFIPKILIDTPSGSISIKYGLKGINYCPVSACASSNTALMDAFNFIRWNKADLMVAGGSEAAITRSGIGGFGAMKALSTRNDDPQGASRPFDQNRDGFVMGEGAGAIILEEYEHAVSRGATIYAEMVGSAMTADAFHMTATHPEGEGAFRSMTLALEEAGINAAQLDYINCHATSTAVGDISELKAIQQLLGSESQAKIGATKSMTGHLLGAAGAIEGIASIMAVKEDKLPPTINLDDPDTQIPAGLHVIGKTLQEAQVQYALSNTFGFGGHNASVVFKKYR